MPGLRRFALPTTDCAGVDRRVSSGMSTLHPLRGAGLAAHRHFKGCPQSGPVGQIKKKPGIQPGAPKADPLQPAGKS
jgi:hypothetical protein